MLACWTAAHHEAEGHVFGRHRELRVKHTMTVQSTLNPIPQPGKRILE